MADTATGLRHFPPFSPARPLKRCCNRLSAAATLMGDASPPFSPCHPPRASQPPRPARIPFILISRSFACTCHLLSSLRDRYCLIVVRHCYLSVYYSLLFINYAPRSRNNRSLQHGRTAIYMRLHVDVCLQFVDPLYTDLSILQKYIKNGGCSDG